MQPESHSSLLLSRPRLVSIGETPSRSAPEPRRGSDRPLHPGGPAPRSRILRFVALRLLLTVATSYLLLVQSDSYALSAPLAWLIALGLLSNGVFFKLPAPWLRSPLLTAGVVVADTLWISAALLVSGHFRPEFFYVYFLILFVAGIGENLRLIVLGAGLVCAAYLYSVWAADGSAALFGTETLIRVPFLVAVAAFYGYLVDRMRREERRAREEARAVERIAETNLELEAEIGRRRQAQAELIKLSQALEQSPAMVIIADTDGTIEYVNPRYIAVSGYSAAETVGRTLAELGLLEKRGEEDPWQELRSGGEWRGEAPRRTRDGEKYWVSIHVSAIRDGEGETTHLVAVLEDQTQAKEAEAALVQANDDLKRLNQMKSDFISTVSHELRTPLTAMTNALDILGGLDSSAEESTRNRFVAVAERNVGRLTALVNDILDLSRIEAGRLEYRFEELQLVGYLADVLSGLEAQAEAGGIELELDHPATLPTVWADPARLEQILVNLLGNALKFTPAGGQVTLKAEERPAGVLIGVEDTGVGLSDEDRTRIFEPFYQVDDPLTRRVKGSGLGLSITLEMLRAHASDLAVDSRPQRGSRFYFTLPACLPAVMEMHRLEEQFKEFRTYPFFVVLVVEANSRSGGGEEPIDPRAVDRLGSFLEQSLPRAADRVVPLPHSGRVLVVLLGTDRSGGEVVQERLAYRLAQAGLGVDGRRFEARIRGLATYPEEGTSAFQIMNRIEAGESRPTRKE